LRFTWDEGINVYSQGLPWFYGGPALKNGTIIRVQEFKRIEIVNPTKRVLGYKIELWEEK
jgi:hypothetical protein